MPQLGFGAKLTLFFFLGFMIETPVRSQIAVDSALPAYVPVEGVSGAIKSVGSDTMNNLMTLWAEGFNRVYPTVQVEIEGKGSSTAPPALIAGTATFGPMSRSMKDSEIDEFQKRHGFKPTELHTAIDMLAVYVNKDNPIVSLSLPQVDAIFSRTRKGGVEKDIRLWGDLGLGGEWKRHPISLSGRNAASGTYGYFKDYALFGGDFKDSVKELPGSSSVVQAIARDRYAIGYSGVGFRTSDVRPVPLSQEIDGAPVAVEPENAFSGEYPLARFLIVAVNYKPGSALDPLRREFIRYIFSKEGQQAVIRDGYLPVNAEKARETLRSVNIKPDF